MKVALDVQGPRLADRTGLGVILQLKPFLGMILRGSAGFIGTLRGGRGEGRRGLYFRK